MEKKIRLDLLTSTLFTFIFVSYITTAILNVPIIPIIGKYVFLGVILLLLILLFKFKFINRKEFTLFLPFVLFNVYYLINLESFSDTGSLMIVVNQLAYLMVIYVIYSITWTNFQIKLLTIAYFIAIPILLGLIYVTPGMINTNTIGSFTYFLSFFPLLYLAGYAKGLKKSSMLLVFAMTIIVIFASDTRSVLLSAGVAFMTFILWRLITKNKMFYYLYFSLVIFLNYFIIVIYPNLYKWSHFHKVNDLSLQITGKPIMTGRNTIWAQLLDLIERNLWFGHGSNVLPETFLSTALSAHNLYLQIALQSGLIGIILLLIFFLAIWRTFWKNKNDPRIMIASCFFISIIIHQTFEVTLTQNQFSIGLLQWMIVGFGLAFALNKSNYKKTEPK